MNYVIWLFVGAVVGGLATLIIRNRRTDLLSNIVVGIIGAFLAGYLLVPMFHINKINQGIFSLPALCVSLIGAVILLAVIYIFRREKNVKNSVIEGKWDLVSSKIHTRWGKLTAQDIADINANHAQFIVALQGRYGFAKKEAEDQIQRYIRAVLYN
jgi:uncharacterized membrane protein YeaQ/YmgE (transglycosylase-associated protein family)/uncharacterized protein YjbJ (UPF0337 family)